MAHDHADKLRDIIARTFVPPFFPVSLTPYVVIGEVKKQRHEFQLYRHQVRHLLHNN